jgi:hypothetical protein
MCKSLDRHMKVGVGGETTSPIQSAIRKFSKDKLLSENKHFREIS